MRKVDEWGRVTVDSEGAIELLWKDIDISTLPMEFDHEIERYNTLCKQLNRKQFILKQYEIPEHSPEEEHERRSTSWFVDEEIQQINVRDFILSLCKTEIETKRVNMEMDLFEEKNLLPILKLMIFLVDNFRQNKIVWGVGRGSSVASYVLYLIGVHRIDSIKYNLDIKEFIK